MAPAIAAVGPLRRSAIAGCWIALALAVAIVVSGMWVSAAVGGLGEGVADAARVGSASLGPGHLPAMVDPLLAPTTTLTGPSQPTSGFGSSVAVSKDGDTVAIGGNTDDEGRGAVWVFTRSGDSWVQQGPKLAPSGPSSVAYFGSEMAISASGNTILVGDHRPGPPVAWVFTLEHGVWRQQGSPLAPRIPHGERGESGEALALSATGTTAVVSDTVGNTELIWTYTRSGPGWRPRGRPLPWPASGAELSANGGVLMLRTGGEHGAAQILVRSRRRWRPAGHALAGSSARGFDFGASIALSADGSTALAEGRGRALLYRRARRGWVQVARLRGSPAKADLDFAGNVALSSDGRTALVGASPAAGAPSGATSTEYVFTRTAGDHWAQTARLPGLSGPVALSGDAGTIVVPPPDETGTPAHVFMRSGAGWRAETPALPAAGAVGTDPSFGGSFALSADGSTALVAEGDSAWVLAASGSSWVRQAQLRLPPGIKGEGVIVALSGDGDTAVLAGPPGPGGTAAWVFTRTGTTWSTEGTPLLASGANTPPAGSRGQLENLASGIAVSADGDTVLLGAEQDGTDTGAAFVFARSGAGWSQQGPKLTVSDPSTEERLGSSVALSADGETILVGAPGNSEGPTGGNPPPGAAYVFTRTGAAWTQSAKLIDGEKHPYSSAASIFLGSAVALSADGNTALLGAHSQALPFTRTASGWSQAGAPLTPYSGEHNGLGAPNAFGDVLALSGEGTVALIGGLAEDGCGKYMLDPCSRTATVWAFSLIGTTWVRQPEPLVHELPFGSKLALSANGEIALIEGVTPGFLPGGAVFVSRLTPPPQSGFVVETTTKGYYGNLEQQVWSATAATFRASARVRSPIAGHRPKSLIYGTAVTTVRGPENATLSIAPRAAMKRYLKKHKHLELLLTIEGRPQAPTPPTTQTLTVPITLTKPPPPAY